METGHVTLQPWNIDGSLKGLFMLQNERSGCILSSRGRCTSFEIHIRKAKVAFQCACDHGHGCIADHSWWAVLTVAPVKILAISTSHPMVEKHMSNRQPDMAQLGRSTGDGEPFFGVLPWLLWGHHKEPH